MYRTRLAIRVTNQICSRLPRLSLFMRGNLIYTIVEDLPSYMNVEVIKKLQSITSIGQRKSYLILIGQKKSYFIGQKKSYLIGHNKSYLVTIISFSMIS